MDARLVEESTSEYNSPIFLIPKRSKKILEHRILIDFCQVNKKLHRQNIQMVNTGEIVGISWSFLPFSGISPSLWGSTAHLSNVQM